MRNCLRKFLNDKRGLGAVEFALIAPALLLIYLGSVDLADGVDTNKKVSRSASSLADLVARQLSVTKNDLNDMFNISRASLLPYGRSAPKIRITAIRIDGTARASNLTPEVDWSYANIADFRSDKGFWRVALQGRARTYAVLPVHNMVWRRWSSRCLSVRS